jgi:hypothetical protein
MSNGLDTGEQPYDERHNTAPTEESTVDAVNRVARELREKEQARINGEHENGFSEPRPSGLFSGTDTGGRYRQFAHPGGETPMPEGDFRPTETFERSVGLRPPLIHPHVAEHGIPSFGSGLNWVASTQSPVRPDLVNFDWARQGAGVIPGFEVSNIELRTIYAHLLETAGRIRAEMRERQMQVDL